METASKEQKECSEENYQRIIIGKKEREQSFCFCQYFSSRANIPAFHLSINEKSQQPKLSYAKTEEKGLRKLQTSFAK
ncbi:uncharacterized protein [Drosophila pseudoobscura]|uniref:Uncharacterized protein isoform X4 n=1 Tax=Drosophila pseudoobscura pseudoobscura TaxID=46245 RepID=A0A6I8W238_DROPS|nr:uncharacterized protein LOC26533542 isoform X4 [Drosophila pseudoobscura]